MSKEQKKSLGVPRPKKSGSVSASKSSPKKDPGFPATPSRKEDTWIPGWGDASILATSRTSRGFVTVKIHGAGPRFSEIHMPSVFRINDLIEQLITARDEMLLGRKAYALGIAAKNPQRESARIRSGKPDPKGNAQKKKQRP